MKWLAPAKINLSLRVLGRRADGFHALETLMAPLSLADEITFDIGSDKNLADAPRIRLECSDSSLPTGAENLAWRAAELFRTRVSVELPPMTLHLRKNIPHGAGLGGGSSDAATVLLGLNECFNAKFTPAELASMAGELGSDAPFFVYRSAAVCRGRGELVEPVQLSEKLSLLLLKPSFPVPTPWAYRRWSVSHELPGVDYSPQNFVWGKMSNDLERPVFEKYLLLPSLKMWLRDQAEVFGALMSGSGSTMIAVLRSTDHAEAVALRAKAMFGDLWTCACSTV